MAVKKPAELDFSSKKFMCIISGQPGLGKTTLALSAPRPFLFDTDNGVDRVRAEHRESLCGISVVSSYDELLEDMESADYKAAETAVVDTGGTLVQLLKDWARRKDAKSAKDNRAMYGVIKTEFDRLCWRIRTQDRKNLVVLFHTTEQVKGDVVQTRLSCEGSAKDIVWTPADFGGYLFMMGSRRMVGFTPTEEYFAKGCFGVSGLLQIPDLKAGQANTFLTDLFRSAQQNIDQEMERYSVERERYQAAMEQGRAAVAAAVSPETALEAKELLGGLEHALTSRAELSALFRERLAEAGLKWDKEADRYVLDDAKPA